VILKRRGEGRSILIWIFFGNYIQRMLQELLKSNAHRGIPTALEQREGLSIEEKAARHAAAKARLQERVALKKEKQKKEAEEKEKEAEKPKLYHDMQEDFKEMIKEHLLSEGYKGVHRHNVDDKIKRMSKETFNEHLRMLLGDEESIERFIHHYRYVKKIPKTEIMEVLKMHGVSL